MELKKPWEQLARYFAGELSPEENKKMKSWIKADRHREEKVKQIHKIWKEAEYTPYQIDVDQAWNKLSGDIDEFENSKKELISQASGSGNLYNFPIRRNKRRNKKRPGRVWRRVILVAATVLIVVSAGVFSYQIQLQNESEVTSQEFQIYETRNGERATYILSDGSKVILHAGSRLEISNDYNRENRKLFLEGEAYFETVHDPEKPFIVHSNDTYTRVLGTRFLVQAWPETEGKVEVVVSEGKVAFGNNHEDKPSGEKEVLITQNKMGVLAAGQAPVVTNVTNMNWYIGWTEGRLEFENRPLSEVLPRLERWYNIEIRVEDEEIREKKITAEIDYSQSMTEVLQGIALALGLEIEKKDRTVTFFKIKSKDYKGERAECTGSNSLPNNQ